ncbi:hypothetical protein GCM10027578_19730 [Spirosoma luteolum]
MSRVYALLASRPVTLLLLLLPIAVFFVYFFALRYNIPWFDEYENIPYFLDRFLNATSFSDRMAALLRPNNEHRVLYARLVVLGQYVLTGGLNFAGLMLWGNLGLVLIFWLIYRALRRAVDTSAEALTPRALGNKALLGLLPVPLLLFTAQNYLLTFTAIYTLQYLAIIVLVVLTFFVLATNRPLHFGLALALGMLSTFSMGNGLLLWPAGAGLLFIQRRWLPLGIWIGVGVLSGYLYFLGYPVQQGNAEGFAYVTQHPFQTVAGFLVFAGSVFDLLPMLPIEQRAYLPFLMGLIGVTGLGYWLTRTLLQTRPNTSFFEAFVFGCLLFLLANIGLIAVFRIRFYFGMVLHSSYRTYSLVLWSMAVVLLFSRLHESRRRQWWPLLWLGVLALNVISYLTYVPEAVERRKHMQGITFDQHYTGIGLGGTRNSYLARYIADLTKLMHDRGWYDLPQPAITPDERGLTAPAGAAGATVPLRVTQRPDYVVVDSQEPDYHIGMNEATYLILKSERQTYLMLANRNRPLGRRFWRAAPGFSAAMPTALVQAGRYRIGLFRTYPDHTATQYTDRFVDIP